MDASSAIILCKANLHLIVAEMYDVVLPQSAYNEITGNSLTGADEYKQLLADNLISIQSPLPVSSYESASPRLNSLGQGEYDSIQLYHAGYGDFVITDDGAAAKYCKQEQIRFINALLIPKILECIGKPSDTFCLAAFDAVTRIGRYSQWVIDFAKNCGKEELAFFLP